MNKQSGLTLMELTVVLAIVAIIAAILIPTFLNVTDRARLRSDIASARVIQNAMALYQAERGQAVAGANMREMMTRLANAYFLDASYDDIQTSGAHWVLREGRVMVDISQITGTRVENIASNLPEDEQRFIFPAP